MSRIKELQCELTEAHKCIRDLTCEVKTLKVAERRLENALAKYEGTHAQLPQVIRSYGEDLRTLQTRLRRDKVAYRELEDRHRALGAELAAVQGQHKHLLDLTKNKQLAEREKLSNQLEEAENKIKQLEKRNQNLIKKVDLLTKNHRDQIAAELGKIKLLQAELNHVKETNDKLTSKLEKIRYQSYGGRRSYVWGGGQSLLTPSGLPTARSKSSVLGSKEYNGQSSGDGLMSTDGLKKSPRPELVHGESEISDHTKDLQKNLMRQIHEDVINKPDMLVNEKTNKLNSSELIKENDLSDAGDENIAVLEIAEPVIAVNPYSLPKTYGTDDIKKLRPLTDSKEEHATLISGDKTSTSKPDDGDDDASSSSSVSDLD